MSIRSGLTAAAVTKSAGARGRGAVVVLAGVCVLCTSITSWAQNSGALEVGPQVQTAPVHPNLNVTPKRLTFKRGERSATVYIYNQGSSPAVFDISMVDRVMLPSGDIEPTIEAAKHPEAAYALQQLKSAKPFLVATPRRAVLAPGKGQTVRVRVTTPADASAAEYRSHLTIITVPPRDVGMTAEQAAAAEERGQLSFQITSVFGISIPVIVRTGVPDVRAHIASVRLTNLTLSRATGEPAKPTPVLMISLVRDGSNSLFGNLEVRSKKSLLGIARGVGVYPEISDRLLYLPLERTPLPHEPLDLSFVDDDITPGRTIARTTFVAP